AYPVITELGFSGIWFGVIMVKMIEIGLLTPPFGINAYLVAGVVKGVRVEDAFRGAFPFVVAERCVVALLVLFPELVTWLPELAQD
ncbi:MAG: TRAP transporter large permease subunit, partial [Solirubrobacterales bacterium]